jgi:hypothetical protein
MDSNPQSLILIKADIIGAAVESLVVRGEEWFAVAGAGSSVPSLFR